MYVQYTCTCTCNNVHACMYSCVPSGSCLTIVACGGCTGGGGGEWDAVPLLWDGPTELGRGVEVWREALPGATAARSLLVELGVDGRSLLTCWSGGQGSKGKYQKVCECNLHSVFLEIFFRGGKPIFEK